MVIGRAALLAPGATIRGADLPLEIRPRAAPRVLRGDLSLAEMEKEYVLAALDKHRGHRGRTAEGLGIDPKTLYNKLRAWGVSEEMRSALLPARCGKFARASAAHGLASKPQGFDRERVVRSPPQPTAGPVLARWGKRSEAMKTPSGTGTTRVMVADDNLVVRRLLVVRLRAAGCRVSEATDGLDALEQFRKEPVQVVITDLSMPHMNGLELLAALRAQATPPEVILLTGSRASDAEAAVQALRLGAHDYISKTPAAVEAVALAVERAAEKWRLREENARLVAELRRMSLTDALTGVGNRRALDEALQLEIARARRARCGLALVLLDIDHFKRINDTLGHVAGDEVLAAFTERLRSNTRDADRVFRYGGEEFALLVAAGSVSAALAAAERVVRATAAAPLRAGHRLVDVTCSAGVSLLAADDGACGSALLARADAALYAAKRAGRNRAVAFDDPAPVDRRASVALQARAC